MRVSVVGAGSIGGYVGVTLAVACELIAAGVVRHIEGDRSDQCVDLGIAPPRRLVKLLARTTQEEHVSIRAQPFGR